MEVAQGVGLIILLLTIGFVVGFEVCDRRNHYYVKMLADEISRQIGPRVAEIEIELRKRESK